MKIERIIFCPLSCLFSGLVLLLMLPSLDGYGQKAVGRFPGQPRTLGGISLAITTTNPSCRDAIGQNGYLLGSGIIMATASGGTPPYTYYLANFALPQNNGYFPGLDSGKYDLIVTDANGLTTSDSVYLNNYLQQPIVTISVNKLPTSCMNADGSFTAVPFGGTPPYTYSFDGGVTYTSNPVFSNLSQGVYLIYLKDANGCIAQAITSPYIGLFNYFFCNQCCNLSITASSTSTIACSNEGYFYAWASNGSPPYQYSIDAVNYFTVNYSSSYVFDPYEYEFTNLTAGLYHVYVKDNTGAISSIVATVSKSCYVAITYVGVDASCQQNDGSVTINAGFGTPPYTYTMDGVNFQTSNVFTGLGTGSYPVTVRDANGETYSRQVTVFNKCPQVSATATNETCGQGNAVITATGTKGTTPYQFSLDGGAFQFGNVFSGLSAGNHTVTIKDAGNFTSSAMITVYNNCVQLVLASVNETCTGKNGSITATGSNGIAPYQYALNGGNYQSSGQFSGLSAGSYTITVQDASLLTTTAPVSLTDAPAPQISAGSTRASCTNTGGTITVSAIGGTAPFQYSIDNEIDWQSSGSFNGLDSGGYTAYVRDANGCTVNTGIQVTALPTPQIFLGHDTTICTNDSLILQAPSAPGYTYLWQDNSSAGSYIAKKQGTYTLKVTNQDNCSATASLQLSLKPLPVFSLGHDTILCSGSVLSLNPALPPTDGYLWSTGSQARSIAIGTAGLYWLQASANGCSYRDSIVLSFKPTPFLDLGNDTTLCEGQTLLLDVTNPNASYLWQDGSTGSEFKVEGPGNYSVKVSENGCDGSGKLKVAYISKPVISFTKDTALCITQQWLLDASYPQSTYLWQDGTTGPAFTISKAGVYSVAVSNICGETDGTVDVTYENCSCKIYVPNAFIPGNGGANNLFRPKFICLMSGYELKIFNRWGQLVFSTQTPEDGWDGDLKGTPQTAGTYVWMMKYKDDLTGKSQVKQGTLLLIR